MGPPKRAGASSAVGGQVSSTFAKGDRTSTVRGKTAASIPRLPRANRSVGARATTDPVGQASLTAATSLPNVSLASPNSNVVFSSKRRSLSMPANPGRMERLRKMTAAASSALMIGMP